MSGDTSDQKQTPAELEADIARQREQIAATVNELQQQVTVRAKTTAQQAAIAAGLGALVLVVVLIIKKRRS